MHGRGCKNQEPDKPDGSNDHEEEADYDADRG